MSLKNSLNAARHRLPVKVSGKNVILPKEICSFGVLMLQQAVKQDVKTLFKPFSASLCTSFIKVFTFLMYPSLFKIFLQFVCYLLLFHFRLGQLLQLTII